MSGSIVRVLSDLCGTQNDETGATCARPRGHQGLHMTADHKVQWSSGPPVAGSSAPAAPTPGPPADPCGARHPMGKTCGLGIAHPGPHAAADYSVTWANRFTIG